MKTQTCFNFNYTFIYFISSNFRDKMIIVVDFKMVKWY